MTLKQMLDDKDKKINDLRNEIKDLNEIKEFWITGLQIKDNFGLLKGRVSYFEKNELYLNYSEEGDYLKFYYVSIHGTVEGRRISYTQKFPLYMPISLGKYLGLEPR